MIMCSQNIFKNANVFNNKGFTFVNMLCAFSLFLVLVFFLPLGLRMLYQEGIVETRLQKMEWEVFAAQVKKEVRTSDYIRVSNNKLTISKEGESITYERYGANIRRRVDLKGHEIILQNVKTVTFSQTANGGSISVLDIFDQQQTVNLRTMIGSDTLDVP